MKAFEISTARARWRPTRRAILAAAAIVAGLTLPGRVTAIASPLALEKEKLKLGFIKLTDMAPLAVAKELGYFEDEGLFVTLEAQANWKVLLDRVITGELDGAHMPIRRRRGGLSSSMGASATSWT